MRTRFAILSAAIAGAVLLSSCSSKSNDHAMPKSPPSGSAMQSMPGMSGHGGAASSGHGMQMASGTGLNATVNGYTLTVGDAPMTGMKMPVTFTITKDGKAVTDFDREQTKLMHFYLIRSDLSGFQHLHPTLSSDGTWTVAPAALEPGSYRQYVQFLPHADAAAGALVLSTPITVSGSEATKSAELPAPSTAATVDGYTVAVAGTAKAGTESPLTLTVARDGKPVTDLQPYLDTYAHVTAIHAGDLAFAHLHPNGTVNGDHGGPALTVQADLAAPGAYRMFIQFQTAGTVHTAALTISAT